MERRWAIPVVSGSDTHQAVQYGCIRTKFEKETSSVADLYEEMKKGAYEIVVSDCASFQVRTAGLLKKALKEIYASAATMFLYWWTNGHKHGSAACSGKRGREER